MTIIRHELRQGLKTLAVWTAAIGFFIVICVFMYPEMKGETAGISDMFASMGSFSAAFGMDRINFGTLMGFYSVECGNILGLGGAFFAALIGVTALSKEEKEKTAEFLLAHPISRRAVVAEKLVAVMFQIIIMNAVVYILTVCSVAAIGEEIMWKEISLLHLMYFIMQIETAGICFGISAFLRRGSIGIGLGIAALAYFMNIVANITERASFLKYITPFGYTDGAEIISGNNPDAGMIIAGVCITLVGICAAFAKYTKKDIS